MTMIDNYNRLRKTAWSGIWGKRLLSELQYLLELSRAKEGKHDEVLASAIQKLDSYVSENGCITKEICTELEKELSFLAPAAKELTVLLIAHAHIDMNWMWGFNETVSLAVSTFETMLKLMEEYPQFKFSQSQASVYKIVEEYAPYLLPVIRQRIKEGRWEVTASTWVENDKNMSSAESMARHLLYTRNYLSKLLDIDKESLNIDFEPDTFGHAENGPEILSQGGVKYYYHCRGYHKEHIYRWRAPSGTEVLVYREPVWYNDELARYDSLGFVPSFCKEYGITKTMKFYGVGDHGGGPTRKEIEHWLEMQTWPLMPTIQFGTLREFYASLEEKREQFPVVEQELNYIFSGCYTTQARVKRANKLGEDRLSEADIADTMAGVLVPDYKTPSDIKNAWTKVLFNQFHDILPGSGVIGTYQHALGETQRAMAAAQVNTTHAMKEICAKINTEELGIKDKEDYSFGAGVGFGTGDESGYLSGFVSNSYGHNRIMTVFNPTQYTRKECMKIVLWDWDGDLTEICAFDEKKNEVPVQVIKDPENYWAHKYFTLLMEVEVPAFGYATYVISQKEKAQLDIDWEMFSTTGGMDPRIDEYNDGPIVLENSKVKAVFDPMTMLLTSFTDKATGKELAGKDAGGFRYILENTVNEMTAWRIGPYEKDILLNETNPVTILKRTDGKICQSVTYELKFEASRIEAEVFLKADSSVLEFNVKLDWHELGNKTKGIPQLVFRVPVSYQTDTYCCTVPGGIIDRKGWAQDVPCLGCMEAVDAGESSIAVISDCKYGFRGYDNTVSLTLLRAPYDPDPTPDQGEHYMKIGITAVGDKEDLTEKYDRFIHPLYAVSNSVHEGELPLSENLLNVTGNVKVDVLKKAENGDGIIIRLYNLEKEPSEITLSAGRTSVRSAEFTDILEEVAEVIEVADGKVTTEIPAAAHRTIRICL